MTKGGQRLENFRAERISCARGGRLVFEGLSFRLAPGEALVVQGPNGSGKTSLLRLCAGLGRPETGGRAGGFFWGDTPVQADLDAHKARTRYVGHATALKPLLTLAENLRLWAALYGVPDPDAAVIRALSAVGLMGQGDFPVRILSSGQARRASLARLWLQPVDLWILDEPTVGLDRASMDRLSGMMHQHLREGGQIIAATHQDLGLSSAASLDLSDYAVTDPLVGDDL